ncbi:MAG: ABC transporter ATP-binding protein, partial [Frankia sp.]|nr:ABC transporter ATP-binding protein [Frankia sp.]
NPELSGRDNVYLNASLLGLSRREVDRHFDDIVAFSELAPFIDNQVKFYSSGMYVRLGFAVAVHIDPDILLVDEVLAVGDEAFQRKCLAKISEFQRAGRTILFVTHALDLVPEICDRGVVLSHGRVMHDGAAAEATQVLRGLLGTSAATLVPPADGGVRITDLRMLGPGMERLGDFFPGDPLDVEVDLASDAAGEAVVQASYTGPADIPVLVMRHPTAISVAPGAAATVRFTIPALPAIQGLFALAVVVTHPDGYVQAVRRHSEALRVVGPTESHGIVDVVYQSDVTTR